MGQQVPQFWLDTSTGELIEIVNASGQEVLDPTPVAPPVGFERQESMFDIVQRMLKQELLKKELGEQGFETFEEADDFEVGDDFEPYSPHENDLDPDYATIRADVETSQKLKAAVKGKPASEEPVPAPEAKTDETETPAS